MRGIALFSFRCSWAVRAPRTRHPVSPRSVCDPSGRRPMKLRGTKRYGHRPFANAACTNHTRHFKPCERHDPKIFWLNRQDELLRQATQPRRSPLWTGFRDPGRRSAKDGNRSALHCPQKPQRAWRAATDRDAQNPRQARQTEVFINISDSWPETHCAPTENGRRAANRESAQAGAAPRETCRRRPRARGRHHRRPGHVGKVARLHAGGQAPLSDLFRNTDQSR